MQTLTKPLYDIYNIPLLLEEKYRGWKVTEIIYRRLFTDLFK